MKQWFKRFLGRSETGQSVVILALGMIALLAFVGITTDVSIMFVRYATLKRAVDSAAISAANQVRQDTSIATVSLAARQFIELHGLDPVSVLVDLCESTDLANPDPELCTKDQRKLVRVTAQVESPTFFLRLVGWQDFTLEASSISETAVLDVVLIMDVSESMLTETSLEDWAKIRQGKVYVPPRMADIPNLTTTTLDDYDSVWNYLGAQPPESVSSKLVYDNATPVNCTDIASCTLRAKTVDVPAFVTEYGAQAHRRPECRVRFSPIAPTVGVGSFKGYFDEGSNTFVNLSTLYSQLGESVPWWDGFTMNYNWYGCCNDPDGDFNFSDLVCQPFKAARDATAEFLDRIDFLRGDRVAFVTFDRTAFLINPYSDNLRTTGRSHMIDNLADAQSTLTSLIGVRAEPNFYVYESNLAGNFASWKGYAAGMIGDESVPVDYFDPDPTADRDNDPRFFNYPIYNSCDMTMSVLGAPFSPYDISMGNTMLPNPSDAGWNAFFRNQYDVDGKPYVFSNGDYNKSALSSVAYELRAGCRGTNIGAALREGNNALLDPDTSRRFGAVWVMVMLGDGAAGASDPVRRNGAKLNIGQPYYKHSGTPVTYGLRGEYGAFGVCPYGLPNNRGELVNTAARDFPYCSDESPMSRHSCDFRPLKGVEFMQDNDYYSYTDALADGKADGINGPLSPETELDWNRENIYDLDLANCSELYDVDDYARDWADYIGLERYNDAGTSTLLPTIFTIGFGIRYNDCALNIGECLGEQMLRYIADVGDDNQIDNDYYQYWLNGEDVAKVFSEEGGFGQRGPCQTQDVVPGDYLSGNTVTNIALMYEMLGPQVSCGNYFSAPDPQELGLVFDQIASRMFTRIAQ